VRATAQLPMARFRWALGNVVKSRASGLVAAGATLAAGSHQDRRRRRYRAEMRRGQRGQYGILGAFAPLREAGNRVWPEPINDSHGARPFIVAQASFPSHPNKSV